MSKLADVNTTDIPDAIRLGCRCMSSIFNADDNNVPFFSSSVWPDAALDFSKYASEAHVPGRHLNALLNAEDVLGITIANEVIENHRQAAMLSYSGPLPLALNRLELTGQPIGFCPHNIREGFHALYSLAKYRNDSWAIETAEKSIGCILETWDPKNGWDFDTLEAKGLHRLTSPTFIQDLGRSLGSLVKYYKATDSAEAMKLIHLVSERLTSEFFTAEGRFNSELFGTHTHSVTCCMSSLAQLGELLEDEGLLTRVKAFYDNGLWELRDEIGWSCEDTYQPEQKESDHGEANNAGDIVEAALILGKFGYDEYYADAERIVRGHLLASQLRDVSFIREPENPEGLDGLRNMADRHRGAWGFPAPYGHKSISKGRGGLSFNMDIVGGVTGSLCEVHRNIATRGDSGWNINLLFDYDSPDISIRSPYTNNCLAVSLGKASALSIRIPQWVERQAVQVSSNTGEHHFSGSRLVIPAASAGEEIQIRFPLPESVMTMSRNHVNPIRVKLKGDSIVGMDNHGANFVFFDPF